MHSNILNSYERKYYEPDAGLQKKMEYLGKRVNGEGRVGGGGTGDREG